MILIIKKIKNKIAYQMGVAASQKVKYIWNLNVGCQNSHKTIKQEPHTDYQKKKKTRATHTTKTEGTRRIVSVKTEEKEEEEEEEKRSGWIKQEEG